MLSDKTIVRNKNRNVFMRAWMKVRKYVSQRSREKLNREIQHDLDGISFTIFSNNCLGGVFYHDAGKQFLSPTVNMAFDGEDFIKFLEDPRRYYHKEFHFFQWPGHDYPLAKVDDIELRFVHYKTEKECIETWNRRFERIVWDNIFVVATDVDGLYQPQWLERFDKLPYKNKIMFVAKEYPEYDWAISVKQFRKRHCVHILTDFANLRGERYYETAFDIGKWIKSKSMN